MFRRKNLRRTIPLILLSALLAACGGGSGDDDDDETGSGNWDSMKWDQDDWASYAPPRKSARNSLTESIS